jgi:hypothetical protein
MAIEIVSSFIGSKKISTTCKIRIKHWECLNSWYANTIDIHETERPHLPSRYHDLDSEDTPKLDLILNGAGSIPCDQNLVPGGVSVKRIHVRSVPRTQYRPSHNRPDSIVDISDRQQNVAGRVVSTCSPVAARSSSVWYLRRMHARQHQREALVMHRWEL